MNRLAGKSVIVTGGAIDIGRACVSRMAEEGAKAAVGAAHPLGRMGEPDDITWAVVWPASDEAKFVTGAEIVIDGGYTAR